MKIINSPQAQSRLNFIETTRTTPFISAKTINDSIRLNDFKHAFLRIKSLITKKKSKKMLTCLDISSKIRNKIFNESTIFKLYFDLEKLKLIVLGNEKMHWFENMKLDFETLFKDEIIVKTKKKKPKTLKKKELDYLIANQSESPVYKKEITNNIIFKNFKNYII